MVTVKQLSPVEADVDLDATLKSLATQATLRPFSSEAIDFAADLSRAVGKAGRGRPELQALAFWMRRAELTRLAESFTRLESESLVRAPRGTVFHVPPANVDTIFVYSWLLALLTGNRNVVRLSSRIVAADNLLLRVVNETLMKHPAIASRSVMLTYGHDQSTTSTLSSVADVRIIWGGDATVNAVRRSPLAPSARDITFPDRFSLAAINVAAYDAATEVARNDLAERFYNDSYWFDQMGCSSPRILTWVGGESRSSDFIPRVASTIASKGYRVDTATAVAKLTYAYGSMISVPITHYGSEGNELAVLEVAEFPEVRGDFCGGGMFFSLPLENLTDLAAHVERKDQTLSHFGFSTEDLKDFVLATNGRGIDRIVPIGEALNFNRIWDGMDLLAEFMRIVSFSQ